MPRLIKVTAFHLCNKASVVSGTAQGPDVQSIVSLTKFLVKDSLSLQVFTK